MIQIALDNRQKGCRRWVGILSLVFWLVFVNSSLSGAANEVKTPPLTIAYCRYMPFYFEGKNEQPRGILVDIWGQWSHKTGIPVKFVLLPWEETMKKTASGRIDISALMYHTKERETRYLFSTPLMNLSTFLYFRKNDKSGKPIHINKLKDIAPLSIGVVAKDFSKTYLNEHLPDLNPIIFQDHESLVKAAISNNIQAFLMEGPVASTYIAKHNGAQLSRLEDPVYTKPLFAGVKYGNTELIERII